MLYHSIISLSQASLLAERTATMYNLQRKVKTMKQNLDSKELHADVMRKKVASLEERLVQVNQLVAGKEETVLKVSFCKAIHLSCFLLKQVGPNESLFDPSFLLLCCLRPSCISQDVSFSLSSWLLLLLFVSYVFCVLVCIVV